MPVGTAVPCRADAERAAAALADAGVSRVVLFGSVARGDATERSDIDLAAIYDDLDYGTRSERVEELSSLASAAAGHPVEVFVTDRPEWKVRTEQVCTSFESRAAREGAALVDRGTGEVNWSKEMVRPSNDYELALTRLHGTLRGLISLCEQLLPKQEEHLERQKVDEETAILASSVRLDWVCAHVQYTVETALKALIHLNADRETLAWGHDINELCTKLPDTHLQAVRSRLSEPMADQITRWHMRSRYWDEKWVDDPASLELIRDLTMAGCAVAVYTARQFDDQEPDVRRILNMAAVIEKQAAGYDLLTGQPLEGDRALRNSRSGLEQGAWPLGGAVGETHRADDSGFGAAFSVGGVGVLAETVVLVEVDQQGG